MSIDTPGVYTIPDAEYHAHPALSSSGARRLLPPSCPARFKWERDNGRPEKRIFDHGHAAHKLVLGVGPDLVVVDAADWRTKAAKEERDCAYIEGKVPLLPDEYELVQLMAAALLEHPIASALFDPKTGVPEQSLFWHDGIDRRCRLDWLPDATDSRMIVADYKTCVSAETEAVRSSIAKYRYHQQAAWNLDGVTALGLAEDPAFLFVCQEKQAPYLVNVVEPDARALRIGRHLNARGVDIYVECMATDTWPGFSDEVELLSLPAYYERQFEEIA